LEAANFKASLLGIAAIALVITPVLIPATRSSGQEELENLSDSIKQAIFQYYKLAYSEKDDAHIEESKSIVAVGRLILKRILFLPYRDSS
jgi:hypothetical protein